MFVSLMFFVESLIAGIQVDQDKFVPPIVFIDEINTLSMSKIKLLRNLCRILGLPSVLASTNAKVNNLLNVTSASAPKDNDIWVHAIRSLPQANLTAIFQSLEWCQLTDEDNELNYTGLLTLFDIKHDEPEELENFKNLLFVMKKQSETCLQGVALIVYKALKEELTNQSGKPLDVKAIWKHVLLYLRRKLKSRKPFAFKKTGCFHSLAMMNGYQLVSEAKKQMEDQPVPTSKIILETINRHFYFFGSTTDEIVIPFEYDGDEQLQLNGSDYETCSHFKLFSENLFLCLSIWIKVDAEKGPIEQIDYHKGLSVASIMAKYIGKLRNVSTNMNVESNNSSAQECTVHSSLFYSTSKAFSSLNPGFSFLKHFIRNIQIDPMTLDVIAKKNLRIKVKQFSGEIDFTLCPRLESYLAKIQIPYLLPSVIVSREILDKLKGLCPIGKCDRLSDPEGIDIQFDLKLNGVDGKGYVECKYIDVNLGKPIVLDYIVKTKRRNSPFSMLVTSSMQNRFKSADSWKEVLDDSELGVTTNGGKSKAPAKKPKLENVEPLTAEQLKVIKRTKDRIASIKLEIEGISIYSVFYVGQHMKAIPLVEYTNPTAVFVIIQTNFNVPKL